ncbi:MAG: acetyl-CoA carboxylase carboxyltransferase subunit beta [Alphaproteobacteria bacterium]|nr:acetyl-CoA carboxylase carboxyltransferase subunit beta [Alphaproteobacteria bacterium]
MNWITNRNRPTIKKVNIVKDIPDNYWDKCPSCGGMLFHSEIQKTNLVCPSCQYHFHLPPIDRLKMLFDDGKFTMVKLPKMKEDPLNFRDIKKYTDRLKEARKKTNQDEAIVVAQGKMGSFPVVVGVFNFAFMGGSMNTTVGEAIIKAADLAMAQKAALLLIPASGGARMQEGILSLMQMTRTILAVKKLKQKRLPYIVLLTDPTTGGVTASFAMLADVTLAEPGATIGFAGTRVIEQTIHEKLPDNFQKSEYLLEHGMIDQVVPRAEIREKIIHFLNLLMK